MNNKLRLNKQTIAELSNSEKSNIKGGEAGLSIYGCPTNLKTRRGDNCCANSTPQNLETCQGNTCVFLDGCPVID